MTEKKLTYDELVERNRRLANMLIRRNEEFEQTLRAEVKKVKAQALREAANAVMDTRIESETEACNWLDARAEQYKEEA